ncbi:hypothetical protein D3C86_894350 [compost metagenome]
MKSFPKTPTDFPCYISHNYACLNGGLSFQYRRAHDVFPSFLRNTEKIALQVWQSKSIDPFSFLYLI